MKPDDPEFRTLWQEALDLHKAGKLHSSQRKIAKILRTCWQPGLWVDPRTFQLDLEDIPKSHRKQFLDWFGDLLEPPDFKRSRAESLLALRIDFGLSPKGLLKAMGVPKGKITESLLSFLESRDKILPVPAKQKHSDLEKLLRDRRISPQVTLLLECRMLLRLMMSWPPERKKFLKEIHRKPLQDPKKSGKIRNPSAKSMLASGELERLREVRYLLVSLLPVFLQRRENEQEKARQWADWNQKRKRKPQQKEDP